jgi:nitronate monooxygenase
VRRPCHQPLLTPKHCKICACPSFARPCSSPAAGAGSGQCKAGLVGSFPALNARPAELLDTWLTQLQDELAQWQSSTQRKVGPIAVNQIVHQSNDRLAQDVATCVKHQVPIIISSLRAPPRKCWTPCTATAASCCMT